jgi:predicted nucleotidyltransferase
MTLPSAGRKRRGRPALRSADPIHSFWNDSRGDAAGRAGFLGRDRCRGSDSAQTHPIRARCYRSSCSPRLPLHATLERVSTAVAGSPRINAMGEVLAAFPEVRLALLFGSEAKGTARRDSDVDVAVEAPVGSLGQIAAALSSRLGAEVDVVRLETASIPLLEALIADGIVLHEGKRGAGALWRSRVLAQLETDRPWYRRQRDAWLQRVAKHGFSRG